MTTSAGPHIVPRPPAAAPELRAADQGGADALESVLSDHTRRVYETQWKPFDEWCGEMGRHSLLAETPHRGPLPGRPRQLRRQHRHMRLATSAITKAHEWARLESPCRDQGVRAALCVPL